MSKKEEIQLVMLPAPIAKAGCELITEVIKLKKHWGYYGQEEGPQWPLFEILRKYDLLAPNQ